MIRLEGRVTVLAALRAGRRTFGEVLVDEAAPADRVGDLLAEAAARKVAVRRVPAAELDGLTHAKSHGGVVASCSPRPLQGPADLPGIVKGAEGGALLLLLEGADDARNLGFVLRSAEAFGAHAVLLRKRAWDFDEVEVTRPSSGAFERLPLVLFDDIAVLEGLKESGLKLYGCVAGASRTLHETQLWKPCVIAVGGEKRGLSGAVRDRCNSILRIPTRTGSLSLSHAAAVVCAEAMRQRDGRRAGQPESPRA